MSFFRNAFKSSYGEERPAFFWWYPKGTSTKEKKLLTKIDFFILTYCCFGYFAKWLDQANLSNAYVSGMKEDLSMYGNEYTLANTLLNIGSIIGGIPSNLLITWLPPRYVLPACEIAWGLITIGTFKVTSAKQLYVLRFFLGLLEGTSFVGIQYVLGSWYKRTELGKRTAIFTTSSYVGTAFGAYIFSGVWAGMNGYRGCPAWRWAFVVDGIITIVIGVYGLVVFPDTPEKTTAFYLSAEERQRCVERLVEDDRQPVGTFSWDIFTSVLTSWQFYVLSILWVFWETTVGKVGNTAFQLFLKYDTKHQWSLYDINNIPTAINGFNIVMIMLVNIYADATGRRATAALSNLTLQLFGTLCLVVWNIPLGLHILAYLLASCDGPLSPLYMAWANLLCGRDKQVRAMTLAMMNALGNATTTLVQQFAYPVVDAPRYDVGFRTSLGLVCGMVLWVMVVRWCEWRSQQKARVFRDVCED
ncbi:MFS general substrate transporter [Teratosphaeria nubilosa]|uniref:MFS general substrate transporter n=1 Tax=Teratosphaeria nubilosa TaxID=161662 RepID=A0A6G1LI43_9PEZI|nr:MFS general substrate transporter [Teratosphaeria nubilosa]